MLIGVLSERSGLTRDTIRYYEKLQLLVVNKSSDGSTYKNYGPEALERLHQIQQLKSIGFTLREIHQLLASGASHPCTNLPTAIAQKIEKIDDKIAILQKFKSSLMEMKTNCGEGVCEIHQGLPDCVPNNSFSQKKP